jgi:hypothetical protein
MFTKKTPSVINYDNTVETDLILFLGRIEEMEVINKTIERDIQMKALSWDSNLSTAKRTLESEKDTMKQLKQETYNLKLKFINLVNVFRLVANSEDFTKLKTRVDDWSLEKFLTRQEFERMVLEKQIK